MAGSAPGPEKFGKLLGPAATSLSALFEQAFMAGGAALSTARCPSGTSLCARRLCCSQTAPTRLTGELRNVSDSSGAIKGDVRPDLLFKLEGALVFVGEKKGDANDFQGDLKKKK